MIKYKLTLDLSMRLFRIIPTMYTRYFVLKINEISHEDGVYDRLNEHLYSESFSKSKSHLSSHYT